MMIKSGTSEMNVSNHRHLGGIMKVFKLFATLLVLFLAVGVSHADDPYTYTINVFKSAPEVKPFFNNAYGYAVFPTIGKGGLVIGGAHGKGKVYRQGKVTGNTSVTQVSIGFQAGGQAYSQMVFFQDKRAYETFTGGNFEFDATASAVAITAGAQASASTAGSTAGASAGPKTGTQAALKYNKGMAIFVHAKGGLMYEASVGGQKFSFEPLK
jgi:lipid-binding SYLF domain-containing protein